MATYTANYRLKKPGLADYYNIQDFNDNADVIDGKLKLGEEAKSLAESLQTSQLQPTDRVCRRRLMVCR